MLQPVGYESVIGSADVVDVQPDGIVDILRYKGPKDSVGIRISGPVVDKIVFAFVGIKRID
jgi:hypothetical protein